MVTSLINRPCTIRRRSASGVDAYGGEIFTTTNVETCCELQQARRDEPADGGEVSYDTWTIFLLPDESIDTGDAIIVDGHAYELIGEPWTARNPRTQTDSHIEITARRTAGAADDS